MVTSTRFGSLRSYVGSGKHLPFELVDFPERHAVVSVPGDLPLERLKLRGAVPAICGAADGLVVVYAEEEPCVLLVPQDRLVAQG